MVLPILAWIRKKLPWFLRYYNRLEIKGLNHIPKKGSAIITPNHSGGLDLDNFAIMSLFDHVQSENPARKRIWLCYWDKWAVEEPSWAPWVQQFPPIPISLEGGGIPYKLTDKIVERGELIAIMPEGHSASIAEGYRLWRYYPGLIKLHLRYKVPIIPTACIGFVKACPIWKVEYDESEIPPWVNEAIAPIIFPRKIVIHFGKPVNFPKYFGTDVDKKTLNLLASRVRLKVKDIIGEYYEGVRADKPYGIRKLF